MAQIVICDINSDYKRNSSSELLYSTSAINNEIANVLGINLNEYWWLPSFGSNLLSYVHDPLDETTAYKIYIEVVTKIPYWIPYITLTPKTEVTVDYNNNAFNIIVEYTIASTNIIAQFVAVLKRD